MRKPAIYSAGSPGDNCNNYKQLSYYQKITALKRVTYTVTLSNICEQFPRPVSALGQDTTMPKKQKKEKKKTQSTVKWCNPNTDFSDRYIRERERDLQLNEAKAQIYAKQFILSNSQEDMP